MSALETLIMIPGPTHVPPRVLAAMARPMIGHRTDEYSEMHLRCEDRLKQIFRTENQILIFASSGTGGMEAAVVNTLSPGDKVLAVNCGNFGQRFGEIARRFGADVDELVYAPGTAADPDQIAAKLDADAEIKAVLATFNETSTGVTNDMAAIGAAVRGHNALLLVDAISGMAAIECRCDEWGLDVVVAGSQKAFMLPPGLAFVSVSQAAWAAVEQSRLPKFYWDFQAMGTRAEEGQTAYTPAVSMIFALDEALAIIAEEGVDGFAARHVRMAAAVRAAVEALGLRLLADPAHLSNTVTAVRGDGFDPDAMRTVMRDKYNVLLSGGQKELKGKIFRIGHMGAVTEREVLTTISCLEAALCDVGVAISRGTGVAAAMEALAEA
ncbi:MAG: alanine--glyoxylate aminotransferase family protein [Armatimonadota bacterium]